jgi:hypothetical protein
MDVEVENIGQNTRIAYFWRTNFCMRLTCYLKDIALTLLLMAKKMIKRIDLPPGSQGGFYKNKRSLL